MLAPTHRDGTSSDDYEPGGSGHPCSAADVEANRAAVIALVSGVSADPDGDAPVNPLVSAGATAEGDDLELGRTAYDPAIHPYGVGSRAPLDDPMEMPRFYPVKGNIRRNRSRLYHRPDSSSYRVTAAEVWFDSPSAAEAAGFRMARTHPKTSTGEPFEPGGERHGWSAEEVRQERLRAFYGPAGAPPEPAAPEGGDDDGDDGVAGGGGLAAAAAGAAVVVGSASLISRDEGGADGTDEVERDVVVAPVSPYRRDPDPVPAGEADGLLVSGSVADAGDDEDEGDEVAVSGPVADDEDDDAGDDVDDEAVPTDGADEVLVSGSVADAGDDDEGPTPGAPFLSLVTTPPGERDPEPSVHAGAFNAAPVLSLVGPDAGDGDDDTTTDGEPPVGATDGPGSGEDDVEDGPTGDGGVTTTGSEDPEVMFGSSSGAADDAGDERDTRAAETEQPDDGTGAGGVAAAAVAGAGLLAGASLLDGDASADLAPTAGEDTDTDTDGAGTGDADTVAAASGDEADDDTVDGDVAEAEVEPEGRVDPSVTAPLPAGTVVGSPADDDEADEAFDEQAFGAGAAPDGDDDDDTLVAPFSPGAGESAVAADEGDEASIDDDADADVPEGADENEDGDAGAGVAAAATAPLAAGVVAAVSSGAGDDEPESIRLEEVEEPEGVWADETVEVPVNALAGAAAGASAAGDGGEVADASAGSGSSDSGLAAMLRGRDGCGRGLWLLVGLLLLLLLLALLVSRCGGDDGVTAPATTAEAGEQDSAAGDGGDLGAASPLDSDLEASALAALAEAGYDDLALEIDGDTVRLTGRVPSEVDSEAAFATLAAVEGMEDIELDNALEIEDSSTATTASAEGADGATTSSTAAGDAAGDAAGQDDSGTSGSTGGDSSATGGDTGTGGSAGTGADDGTETPVPDPVDEEPPFTG